MKTITNQEIPQNAFDAFTKNFDDYARIVSINFEQRDSMSHKRWLNNKISDIQIALMKDYWSLKRIAWLSVSPFGNNTGMSLYDTSLGHKIVDTSSFLYGFKGAYNLLFEYAEKGCFLYFNAGVDVMKVNSTSDLRKLNYETIQVVDSTTANKIEKTKTGSAYQGKLKNGFGGDIFAELYWRPTWLENSTIFPGLYSKVIIQYGNPWINKVKVLGSIGLIFNVNNSEKDKTFLNIIPYTTYNNFLKDYSDAAKTKTSTFKDLFSVGVKVGIPININ